MDDGLTFYVMPRVYSLAKSRGKNCELLRKKRSAGHCQECYVRASSLCNLGMYRSEI